MSSITESHVEDATLAWLAELGYTVKAGPETSCPLGHLPM